MEVMFVLEVNGVSREKRYTRAKLALADGLQAWKADMSKRPEVTVRREDSHRLVHRLPGGAYRDVGFGVWERVGK